MVLHGETRQEVCVRNAGKSEGEHQETPFEGKNGVEAKETWLGWVVEMLEAQGLNPLKVRPAAASHLLLPQRGLLPHKVTHFSPHHSATLPAAPWHSSRLDKSSIFTEKEQRRKTHREGRRSPTPYARRPPPCQQHNYNPQDASRRGRDRGAHWPAPRAAARRLARGHVRPPPSDSERRRPKSAGHGGWVRAAAGSCVRGGVGAERGGAGSNGRSAAPRLRAALPGHPAAVGAAREHRRFQCQREAGAEGSTAR